MKTAIHKFRNSFFTHITLGAAVLSFSACAVHKVGTESRNPSASSAAAAGDASIPATIVTTETKAETKADTKTAATPTKENQKPNWSYQGEAGPYKWGELNADYALCRDGKAQSPVDLRWVKPHASHKIEFHYQSSPLAVVDDGHGVQSKIEKGSWASVDGHRYELQQIQFHSQSEHTLSGKSFALEAQFVHRDDDGKIAVVSVFFKEGKANDEISKIWAHIPTAAPVAVSPAAVQFNPLDLIPKITTHYSYMGSLTAPPCTEGVNWNVMNTPIEISKDQLAGFRKIYAGNYRPVQPLHGRQPANF